MRIAIVVKTETAKKLRSMAKKRRVSVDELLTAHIPGLAQVKVGKNGTEPKDKIRAFDQWVKSFPKDTPPLSDEAVSRASIYRDR